MIDVKQELSDALSREFFEEMLKEIPTEQHATARRVFALKQNAVDAIIVAQLVALAASENPT